MLLYPLIPAPQEAPLFGGIGQYVVPMPEPGARRQGPKAFLLTWELPYLRQGLMARWNQSLLGRLRIRSNTVAGGP